MIDQALEDNYVIGKLRPDLAELMECWTERSKIYRVDANALLDQPYGDGPREKFDIFYCGKANAPLLIYLHGGYWQRGDKSMYGFVAEAFVRASVDVAVVGYPLCPQVSLTSLVDSVRRALVYLFSHAGELRISRDRFNICGNSAGGHLAAMMTATPWSEIDAEIPSDLIKFAVPLSGLYELAPLRNTSLNDAVGLDEAEANCNSPLFLHPDSSAQILTAVGGAETPVFLEQMGALIESWRSDTLRIEQHVEPKADHFDMIERLSDPASDLFKNILKRIR